MHEIEPFYLWRDDYIAAEDERSPFFNTEYSEFYYDKQLYNFLIHPQWDTFGSNTLYIKVIFVDYDKEYAIIELIGEWNDAINNDIMMLKREIVELMVDEGINKFNPFHSILKVQYIRLPLFMIMMSTIMYIGIYNFTYCIITFGN